MSFFSEDEAKLMQLQLPRHTAKVTRLMANFEKRTGKRTQIVGGHRSAAKQKEVYADSLKAGGRSGQGYRAATPGNSKHEVGAATDLNIIGQTAGDAAKDKANPYYGILADEARKVGLGVGYDWDGLADPYHVEEPESITVLRKEYNAHRARLLLILGAVAATVLLMFVLFRPSQT